MKREDVLPFSPRWRTSTITSTVSRFRIQVAAPKHCHSSGDFDDWLRRLLSYLSLADPSYMSIGMHCLEYAGQPVARAQMAGYCGAGATRREEVTDPNKKANYLSSVRWHVLVPMTKGPASMETRSTIDATRFDT